ncbi:hypothetical protein [Anaeroselena agilis]|uniref:Uncharacterized protein n=1 Tax=Anaeroselena agilis TaxID=3063788 RepID=A0ABU3NVT2_9FIRM|nr:hypothetical protein [Selenomonadales bacterium 4137-cl]
MTFHERVSMYADICGKAMSEAMDKNFTEAKSVDPFEFFCGMVIAMDIFRKQVLGGQENPLNLVSKVNEAVFTILLADMAKGGKVVVSEAEGG